MAEFNIYEKTTTEELKDKIGWWNHSGSADTSELVAICMLLCDKISTLEIKVKHLEAELDQSGDAIQRHLENERRVNRSQL